MFESVVEKVEPLFKSQGGETFWWQVKMKDCQEEYALHQNWFTIYETLKLGDKVEFEVSKARLGKDGTQGIDKKGWLLFDKLRKVEETKPMEGEGERTQKWQR